MRTGYLLLLLLVAATYPQLHVAMTFGDDVAITNVERAEGEDPTWTYGDWGLALIDEGGLIVRETRFDPVTLTPFGEEMVEELVVPVLADPSAKTLRVTDADGREVATHTLQEVCGNGYCSEQERLACDADCPSAFEQEQQNALIEPVSHGPHDWFAWGIAGCVLLVIVLALVMVHANRSKPNPVRLGR